MELKCLRCGCEGAYKYGHMKGHQRYRCKNCGYQFTKTTPRGKPEKDKILALILYLSGLSLSAIEVDESYFGAKRVRGKRGRGAGGKMKIFGMKKRSEKVYTQIVSNCSANELVPIIKKLAPKESTIYSDEWKAYDGLVNAGYKKHYRVTHSKDIFANGRAHVNGIENFWGVAKNRLVKMRGITCEKFNLHLKETECRFNHSHKNIYKLLLSLLKKISTLIYSRTLIFFMKSTSSFIDLFTISLVYQSTL